MQETLAIRYQRIKLLALIGIFALPLLAAWIMVQWRIGIPEQHTAHGQLAPNMPLLAEWPLVEPLDVVDGGDWVLAFDCSLDCAHEADRWWRLHRALGREAPRVTRLKIGGSSDTLPGEVASRWVTLPAWHAPGQVWLLDPEGRAVLTYPRDVEARDVMDDLSHLLRINPDPRGAPERDGQG